MTDEEYQLTRQRIEAIEALKEQAWMHYKTYADKHLKLLTACLEYQKQRKRSLTEELLETFNALGEL